MALSESSSPVYLATSRIYDEECAERIERHKADRANNNWTTVEKDKSISEFDASGKVVVIDCVTLWSNNVFLDSGNDIEKSLELLKSDFEKFVSKDAHFIFVTNEIGSCEQSQNKIQRDFTSLLGWFNQFVASKADEVYLIVSGIPAKLK